LAPNQTSRTSPRDGLLESVATLRGPSRGAPRTR
jgi:hypothetical protein